MKKLLVISVILLWHQGICQRYGQSSSCEINAKTWPFATGKGNAIKSTVRLELKCRPNGNVISTRFCTGTILNVAGDQNILEAGTYILTANHCLVDDPEVDTDQPLRISFNYQSSDANNSSTSSSNIGNCYVATPNGTIISAFQSQSLQDVGYHYLMISNYTIIHNTNYADFALIKLDKPIPPHFRPYYIGWDPFMFGSETFTGFASHHPEGDIKKLYFAQAFQTLAPVDYACEIVYRYVKTVCDLIGFDCGDWFQENVCRHTTVPFYLAGPASIGTVEHGSSGCGLLRESDLILKGNLHGGQDVTLCGLKPQYLFDGVLELASLLHLAVGFDVYGEFFRAYQYSDVRNALNPSNDFWIDQEGIIGRSIACYNNLENLEGYYFPASDVVDDNHVEINSANDITAGGLDNNGNQKTLKVMSRADYTFNAGGM